VISSCQKEPALTLGRRREWVIDAIVCWEASMGLEAKCAGRWRDGAGEVKALLETHELILRGDLKRRFPLATLADVRVEGEDLRFTGGGEDIALAIGAARAGRWAKKITTPPPSLASKLGIGPSSKALVIGQPNAPALQEALAGATAASGDEARLTLAVVGDAVALESARFTRACRAEPRFGSCTARDHARRSAKVQSATSCERRDIATPRSPPSPTTSPRRATAGPEGRGPGSCGSVRPAR
jgi:hypothetical protein